MNEDKLLTKYEVMDYLNISRRHFEKLVTERFKPYLLLHLIGINGCILMKVDWVMRKPLMNM